MELEFPRIWEYKIFAEDESGAREAHFEVINKKSEFKFSKSSKNGKYQSFTILVEVESLNESREFFTKLKAHHKVKMVL